MIAASATSTNEVKAATTVGMMATSTTGMATTSTDILTETETTTDLVTASATGETMTSVTGASPSAGVEAAAYNPTTRDLFLESNGWLHRIPYIDPNALTVSVSIASFQLPSNLAVVAGLIFLGASDDIFSKETNFTIFQGKSNFWHSSYGIHLKFTTQISGA